MQLLGYERRFLEVASGDVRQIEVQALGFLTVVHFSGSGDRHRVVVASSPLAWKGLQRLNGIRIGISSAAGPEPVAVEVS